MKKAKKQTLASPGLADVMSDTRQSLLGDGGVLSLDTTGGGGNNFEQWKQEAKLRNDSTFGDYFQSINREDGFILGGVARLVGHNEFNPDPAHEPLRDENWKRYSEGISEDLLPEFRKDIQGSVNDAHAMYLRDLAMEKMQDRDRLATMGTAGNIGRFAYGMVSPEQLALMALTGGASELYAAGKGAVTVANAAKMAKTASKIADPALRAGQMAKAAAAMEEAAKASGGLKAVGTGLATAAGTGYGFEKLRQSVNFENDEGLALDATLMSTAFAAPFAFLGARSMNRLTRTASMEREVLGVMEKLHKGETLSEGEFNKLREYGYHVDRIGKEETGVYDHTKASDEIRSRYDENELIRDRWSNRDTGGDHTSTVKDGIDITDDHVEVPDAPPPDAPPVKPEDVPDHPPTTFGDDTKPRTRRVDMIKNGWDPKKGKPLNDHHNAWADRLYKKVRNGEAIQVKAKAVLKDLQGRFDGTVYGPIIKTLLKHPELNTKSHLAVDDISSKSFGGLYWGHGRDVMVTYVRDLKNLSDFESRTFIHEYVHAHTQHALDGKLDHVLNPAQKQAVADLKELHAHVEKTLRMTHKITKQKGALYSHYPGDYYGATNVKEFVSEVFSNREFQKLLESIPAPKGKTTALTAVWKGIKKILGVGKELDDSAFARAIGLTDQLIGSRFQVESLSSKVKIDGADTGGPLGHMHDVLPSEAPVPTGPSILGHVEIGGKKVPIRWDISQTLDNSTNPVIRQLGFDLVKNAIGWEGDRAQGITVSERKERIRRVIAGEAHFTMREALNEAVQASKMGMYQRITTGFNDMFYEQATRLARGDESVLTEHANIAGPLKKAAGAINKFYDTMGKRAMDSNLMGAENLPIGKGYVNRIYLQSKLRAMASEHGDDAVYALFASSFKNPKIKGDINVAKDFVQAIRDLEFKTEMSDLLLNAKDMESLRKTLGDHGLSDRKIDSIINVMFDAKETGDGGMPTNLRHRMDLDESASLTLQSGKTIKISDVLENDARRLIDKYTNSMGGYIAFAEHGWLDPAADFAGHIKKSDDWVSENGGAGFDTNKHIADKALLGDMFNYIVGKPMSTQSGSRFDRTMGAMRAYTRSVFLGQLGIASAFELKHAMAMSCFHGAWSQMPTFAKTIEMIRKGIPVDDQLAKDIQHIAGFGNEAAMGYGRQHEISDHTYDRGLTRFERFSEKASHVVDVISGNNSFTSATRNLAAKMTVQHLYDMAAGKKSIDEGLMQRLIHNGIDKEKIPAVLEDINKHVTADDRGVVKQIGWEDWQQSNRETYDAFSLALERTTRDGIQDHNIGETMPWMHTTTGKIIAELRTFNLVAHSKQFLKNVHYQDRTSAMIFMTSFVGEALAYAVQTSLNYSHNPEELNKRLSAERMAKAAIQRMSVLGITSYLIDTPFKYITGKSYFGEGTANTDNRDMFMTPSLMVMKRMVGGLQTATQAMSPIAQTVTTKQEMKDALGILPGINTWGARNVVDFVSSHYPKHDPYQGNRP